MAEDILFLAGIFFACFIVGYLVMKKLGSKPVPVASEPKIEAKKPQQKQAQKPASKPSQPAQKAPVPVHPAQVGSLKNKDEVSSIAWDPKDRFLVSTTRTAINLIETETLAEKDHRVYKIMMQGDCPNKVVFSPKGFFIVAYADTRIMEAYATFKKKNEEGKHYKLLRRFPGQSHGDLTAIQVTPDSKNIMTCAKDTTVLMWSLKGDCIDKLQTKQLAYNMAVISPNGKYLAIATAMSDIKVHHLNYSSPDLKKGKAASEEDSPSNFTGIEKAHFTRLDGHGGGINYLQFTSDSSKILSVSKDGTWKLWDLVVDYKGGFTPKAVLTGIHPAGKSSIYSQVIISPDDKLFVAVFGKEIHFWSIKSGKIVEMYTNSHGGDVTEVSWSPDSKRIATLATDNLVRIFNAPTTTD